MATSHSSTSKFQWMWNANADPFNKTETIKWRPYSDVENKIIEDASSKHQQQVMLDTYHINLEKNRQISNTDKNKQRPVQRVETNINSEPVRKSRFSPNPFILNQSDNEYGFVSRFIKETAKYLKLTREELPSKDHRVIPMVVEKAANGIVEEGTKLKKQTEANFIATMLREKKNSKLEEVWKCCANIYTWDSFLYDQINQTMSSIGNSQHGQDWRSKVNTLGPFCLLLWDNPFNSDMIKPKTTLYRGADLPDNLIKSFRDESMKNPKRWYISQTFTSCTQNRNIAEQCGNVLFIMQTRTAFTINLTEVSEYKRDEEELLLPGITFRIDQVVLDGSNKKYLVYLTVHQRHSKPNQHGNIPANLDRDRDRDDFDRDRDRDDFDRDRDRDDLDRDFDRINLRDNPAPTNGTNLLAMLAHRNENYEDLHLLTQRYGRNIDWN